MTRTEDEMRERIARVVYERFQQDASGSPLEYNWVPGGNSFMQEKARAVADSILPLLSDGWRGMESAPRDGTLRKAGTCILLWDGASQWIARWEIINKDGKLGWWRAQAGNGGADFGEDGPAPVCKNPTHWRPLPPPPVAEGA